MILIWKSHECRNRETSAINSHRISLAIRVINGCISAHQWKQCNKFASGVASFLWLCGQEAGFCDSASLQKLGWSTARHRQRTRRRTYIYAARAGFAECLSTKKSRHLSGLFIGIKKRIPKKVRSKILHLHLSWIWWGLRCSMQKYPPLTPFFWATNTQGPCWIKNELSAPGDWKKSGSESPFRACCTYLLWFEAGHAAPGSAERDACEVDAETDGARHGADRRRDAVTPSLRQCVRLQHEYENKLYTICQWCAWSNKVFLRKIKNWFFQHLASTKEASSTMNEVFWVNGCFEAKTPTCSLLFLSRFSFRLDLDDKKIWLHGILAVVWMFAVVITYLLTGCPDLVEAVDFCVWLSYQVFKLDLPIRETRRTD